jgi:pentachlorophenol monooxygenase/3-(3-hydroxy-phenyl)propionate hydroxylase
MHQVIIIGNGPVGQTTALLLARHGVRSLVLDRRPHRDPVGSKAICQQGDVLDIWDFAGPGRRIAAEGVTWTTARTYYQGHELFSYTFTDRGQAAFPPFVNISQSRTEELLDEAIADEPLIEVRWGHEVTGITQDSLSATVVTAEGSFSAPYVVACAGATSRVLRDCLGVTFDGSSYDDKFLICDIKTSLPGWETERRFHFDPEWNPRRQVLIHPCPDSTYRIDWQVPEDFDVEADDLDGRIRKIVGDAPYEIVWQSVYRFHSRLASRFRVGRVLLAGDCAHLVSPFGARGLNSGVQDAENAAWKLAYVLNGRAPEALLESYHHERHAAARENVEVTGATMRFLAPPDEEAWAWRYDLLSRASGDLAARGQVDSGRLSEPYWYADSPLTTPNPDRLVSGRPARGETPPPGPGVLLPDAPVGDTRLRLLARRGDLVLVCQKGVSGVATYDVDELGLREILGAKPGEVWIVRPDAHVAAVLCDPEPSAVHAAVGRMLGRSPETPETGSGNSDQGA